MAVRQSFSSNGKALSGAYMVSSVPSPRVEVLKCEAGWGLVLQYRLRQFCAHV